MTETIGNSKCKCIMPSEKRQIIKALDEAIERQEGEIKKIQEGADYSKESLLTPEEIIKIHESFKRDFQIVWKKVDNTPECKEWIYRMS